jgi:hypothetical protein
MPTYAGFQLALELTNVFPVKDLVVSGATAVLDLARSLRNSGSDIVVEADLARVFGRARVSSPLEMEFKAKVHTSNYVPLFSGSEVGLHGGPGPTVLRAFQDSQYFATVVTLSLLGYFHSRQDLATALAAAMTQRFEAGLPDVSCPPGYNGIEDTLTACSSQCGAFHWAPYRAKIEEKLRASFQTYRWRPEYGRLTPSVLMGAMDFLYIVNSLPEDRKVTVSSQLGFIPLTIWAHYILGLTVVITNLPGPDVVFGDETEPLVYIRWQDYEISEAGEAVNGEDIWPSLRRNENPEICLHEKDMSVILSSKADEDDPSAMAEAERHPLRGYGTTLLRRLFNSHVITLDGDDIYNEATGLIAGLALVASRKLVRHDYRRPAPHPPINLDIWRIIDAMDMIFSGMVVHKDLYESYAKLLSERSITKAKLPQAFQTLLARVQERFIGDFSNWGTLLIRCLEDLAQLVLVFAHVVELHQCADLPLIMACRRHTQFGDLACFPRKTENVSRFGQFHSLAVFHTVCSYLTHQLDHRQASDALILCSDFGWSVHLSTFGDQDPADVQPEMVHVRKGTPTNSRTGERKLRIRDGGDFGVTPFPMVSFVERGQEYTPRTFARLTRSKTYWTTTSDDFRVTLSLSFETSPEYQQKGGVDRFKADSQFQARHEKLWRTHLTPECAHIGRNQQAHGESTRLGRDAIAVLSGELAGREMPEKTVILLTKGDRYVRWAAVEYARSLRKRMLRRNTCCESCALDHVALFPGDWILIL